MLRTRITEDLGIEAPIVLAPMGFVAMPPLVAAVSNAGGLGLLGASPAPPPVLAEMIRVIRSLTSAPFGAGFLVVETAFGPETTDEHIAVAIAERLPVVTFHWELPPRAWVDGLHGGGTLVWVNSSGTETPIHLTPDEVVAVLPGEWEGVQARAGIAIWCVLRRASPPTVADR